MRRWYVCALCGPACTKWNNGLVNSSELAAQGIFDGLERGEDDISPDPASESIAASWRTGVVKALERQFAGFVPETAAILR